MNFSKAPTHSRAGVGVRSNAAFTVPEMMISVTIFLFLVTGIISATLFGMRWFQISQTKLLATSGAREALGKMTDEIRSCSSTFVGTIKTNGVFNSCTNGQPQVGTGLLIYPTTNTNSFILYFLNPNDQTLRRTCSASGLTTILAQTVTNTPIFQVQDFTGTVLTNNQNDRVIRCTLQFYQTVPNTPVPLSYTLDTEVARRAL